MRTEAEAFDDQPEYDPAFDGDLSPEELAYLVYIEEYNAKLKPLAEWELRDWREERMEDFINFLRNRAKHENCPLSERFPNHLPGKLVGCIVR